MVTEAHPKALLISLYGSQDAPDIWERFSSDFGLVGSPSNEHERDAAVAAVCAREGHYGRWKLDLSCDRFPEEQDPERHWIGPVRYFWPNA